MEQQVSQGRELVYDAVLYGLGATLGELAKTSWVPGSLAGKGRIAALGDDVVAVEIDGEIGHIQVAGGIAAQGARSDAVHVQGDVPGLSDIAITAAAGQPVVRRTPSAAADL
jgi:hypothetical protein